MKAECRANVRVWCMTRAPQERRCSLKPMFVVELGNDLKQLHAREQQEIARILQALSDQIAPHADSIFTTSSC